MIQGLTTISVYRKHETKLEDLYRELKRVIRLVKQKYEQAQIIIRGDFNDKSSPSLIDDIRCRPTASSTRFNIKDFRNTKIDFFYSNPAIRVGSIAVLRPYMEDQHSGRCLRDRL